MPSEARLHEGQNKEEPDHSKFSYQPKHLDEWGAVKNCICKACEEKRKSK